MAELAVLDEKAVNNDEVGRKLRDALDAASAKFVASISDAGVHVFSCELVKLLQAGESGPSRKWGVRFLEHFFNENKLADYDQQVILLDATHTLN